MMRQLNLRLTSGGAEAPHPDPQKSGAMSRQLSLIAHAKGDLTVLLKLNARSAKVQWEDSHGLVDRLVTSYDDEEAYYAEKARHYDWEVTPNFLLDITDQIVKATPEVSGKLWSMFAKCIGTASQPVAMFPPGARVAHMGKGLADLKRMNDGLRNIVQRTASGPFKSWLENEVQRLGRRIEVAAAKLERGSLDAQEFMETVEGMKRVLAEASARQFSTPAPQPGEMPRAPGGAPPTPPPDYRLNGPVQAPARPADPAPFQLAPRRAGPPWAVGPWTLPAVAGDPHLFGSDPRSSVPGEAGLVAGTPAGSPTQAGGGPQPAPEGNVQVAGQDGGSGPNDAAGASAAAQTLATRASNLTTEIEKYIAGLRSAATPDNIGKLEAALASARDLVEPMQAEYQKRYKYNYDLRNRYEKAADKQKLDAFKFLRDELKRGVAAGEREVAIADAKLQVRATYQSHAAFLREPTPQNLAALNADIDKAVAARQRIDAISKSLYLRGYSRGRYSGRPMSPRDQEQLDDLKSQRDDLNKIIAKAKETAKRSTP